MAMESTIGVNLRVTAHSNQGGRKYMEDMFCVAYQPTADDRDLLYAYFGIFDGHGGREAAVYAKHHLMDHIVQQKNFWSDDDQLVLKAIRDGFISTHYAMWKELEKWPKTPSGHPSTSGTTASIAFVRRGKLYIGHVGDSGIVLGYEDPETKFWRAKPLTRDHKPESALENARITQSGGKVIVKSGVPRVVWNRPRVGHKGPVRRSTLIDEIPFLAVARSLGDLWSYNSELDEFVVSPIPDVTVLPIDVHSHRCLILGTDGLWNMLNAQDTVNSVYFAEKNNEKQPPHVQGLNDPFSKNWINPSKRLVDRALDRWIHHHLRADNTSVVCVVVDPPGPPKVKRSHVIRHSCSTMQDATSSPVGMSRYCPQEHDTPSPSYNGPVRGESMRQRESLLGSPPRPIATVADTEPRQSTSQVSTKGTSINKPQPSSRTNRVSMPRLKRVTRTSKAITSESNAAASSNPPTVSTLPDVSGSAFYSVSSVSSRNLRESHRNEVPSRPEGVPMSTRNTTSVNSTDDVQIHEISSSSEPSKAREDAKRSHAKKRKGQNLQNSEKQHKKARVEETEVRRPTTRNYVAHAGGNTIPAKRARKVVSPKKNDGKQTKKTLRRNIVVAEKSDNQKPDVSQIQDNVPLIPVERLQRAIAAKIKEKETKHNQKSDKRKQVLGEKSDNHKKSGIASELKLATRISVAPGMKARELKNLAIAISSRLEVRNLRSSRMAALVPGKMVCKTREQAEASAMAKIHADLAKLNVEAAMDRNLRSSTKAAVRVTRTLRK